MINNNSRSKSTVLFLLFCLTSLWIMGCAASAKVEQNDTGSFDLGPAIETNGYRRLALIVGVGDYKSSNVRDLEGPPNDARRFYNLLAGPNGYGFPKPNVCLLIDEQATTARFKEMFQKALVDRAQANDVAVVFFAGHGSKKRDWNGDEPGEWDQTIMLYDARTGG
ncbi:MAG: caspase family protein, partial [Desulfobacterales bacterium]